MIETTNNSLDASVDSVEVARFAEAADDWWDEDGPFRPLHQLNPVRLDYICERLCAHFGRNPRHLDSLKGLRILDIGCGGGLLTEPMTRLGAETVGADAGEENIEAAKRHAELVGLDIDYVAATAEDLAEWGETFDAVLNMEVIEHVADVNAYMTACGSLIRPGGGMVFATLNRTLKAYALAVLGAEYVLRWLPRGTHDWNRFLKPSEFAAHLRAGGLNVDDLEGVKFDVVEHNWARTKSLDVNYMGFATKGAE